MIAGIWQNRRYGGDDSHRLPHIFSNPIINYLIYHCIVYFKLCAKNSLPLSKLLFELILSTSHTLK